MNYFTNEHEMFRESLRDFLNKEVKGNINKWESEQKIPKDIWKKMGEQGFLGLTYPEPSSSWSLRLAFAGLQHRLTNSAGHPPCPRLLEDQV